MFKKSMLISWDEQSHPVTTNSDILFNGDFNARVYILKVLWTKLPLISQNMNIL